MVEQTSKHGFNGTLAQESHALPLTTLLAEQDAMALRIVGRADDLSPLGFGMQEALSGHTRQSRAEAR